MLKTYSTPLFALALMATGCTQSNHLDPLNSVPSPLAITVQVEEITRGSMATSPEEMTSIGLYCASTVDQLWSTKTKFEKISNQQLDYNSTTKDWIYKGTQPTWDYTSIVDRYTFTAYSPYMDDLNGITPSIQDGTLLIEYSTPADCASQPDLMMALPRKDIYPQVSDAVALNFKHTLASIGFSVQGMATEQITQLTIENVVDKGSVTISDEGNVEWILSPRSTITYSPLVDSIEPDLYNPTELIEDGGYLMMIPQSCDNIEVVAEIYDTQEREYSTRRFTLDSDTEWEAGKFYNYTINISSYDYTIEGTSNCYMLHPNGSDQSFYIPVEGRINTFWRDYADQDSACEDILSSSDKWSATILWSDVEDSMDGFSVERVTSGFTPSENPTASCSPDFTTSLCRSAMRVTLPADIEEGNVVVAVEFGGRVLWSWHLWITDYDPDAIAAANIEMSGVYVYSARGYDGQVHRYDADDLWSTLYDDRFIMDRNLGARDCDYAKQRDGVLHYQFGRKDPFPATTSLSVVTTEESCVPFAESVENPTTFYLRKDRDYSWAEEGLTMGSDYLWFDKNVLNSPSASGKSIFDPSPLGWRVPRYGTFTVLNNSNCTYDKNNDIMLYRGEVKLPMTGYRSNNTGRINDYGAQGNLRLSTQIDESFAYNLVYTSDIDEKTNNTLADGFSVRCIQE